MRGGQWAWSRVPRPRTVQGAEVNRVVLAKESDAKHYVGPADPSTSTWGSAKSASTEADLTHAIHPSPPSLTGIEVEQQQQQQPNVGDRGERLEQRHDQDAQLGECSDLACARVQDARSMPASERLGSRVAGRPSGRAAGRRAGWAAGRHAGFRSAPA